MKRLLAVATAIGLLSVAATAFASNPLALPGGEEGCVSQPGDTCTYTATRDGGFAYDNNGVTWTLTVEIPANGDPRDTNRDGLLRYVFAINNEPEQGCGLWVAGSIVTTNGGSDTFIAAGDPFPAASDTVVGSQNDCSAGKVTANNPAYQPVD